MCRRSIATSTSSRIVADIDCPPRSIRVLRESTREGSRKEEVGSIPIFAPSCSAASVGKGFRRENRPKTTTRKGWWALLPFPANRPCYHALPTAILIQPLFLAISLQLKKSWKLSGVGRRKVDHRGIICFSPNSFILFVEALFLVARTQQSLKIARGKTSCFVQSKISDAHVVTRVGNPALNCLRKILNYSGTKHFG